MSYAGRMWQCSYVSKYHEWKLLAKPLHIILVQYHSQPVKKQTKKTQKETNRKTNKQKTPTTNTRPPKKEKPKTPQQKKKGKKAFQLICGDVPKVKALLLLPGSDALQWLHRPWWGQEAAVAWLGWFGHWVTRGLSLELTCCSPQAKAAASWGLAPAGAWHPLYTPAGCLVHHAEPCYNEQLSLGWEMVPAPRDLE